MPVTTGDPERQADPVLEREHHVRRERVRERIREVEAAGDAEDEREADPQDPVGGTTEDAVEGQLRDRFCVEHPEDQ